MKAWTVLIAIVGCIALCASPLRAQPRTTPAPSTLEKQRAYKIEFGTAPAPPAPPTTASTAKRVPTAPHSASAVPPKVVGVEEKPATATLVKDNQAPVAVDVQQVPVLSRGDVLLSATNQRPVPIRATRSGAKAFRLPYTARYVDDAGELRTTEIVTELAGVGLHIVGDATAFVAELFVMLQDHDKPTATDALPSAMEILVTAPVDTVAPELVKFTKLAQWQKVVLTAAHPPDEVTVKLRGGVNVQASLPVPVLRPKTTLTVNPPSIQAYGIETAEVTVRVEGMPSPEGRAVVLEASRGRLSPTRIALDKAGIGSAVLRSEGRGVSRLRATSPPLLPSEVYEMPFKWPVPFLVCALLGGFCGATLRMFWKRQNRKRPKWRLELPAGLLVGLIVAVLGALGVNIVGIQLPAVVTEATIFVLGALGALGGADRLVNIVSKEPAEAGEKAA